MLPLLVLLFAELGLPGQRGALLLLQQAALLLDPSHATARNVLALGVAEVHGAAAAAVAVWLSLRPLVQVWQLGVGGDVVYRARHRVFSMVLLLQGDPSGQTLAFVGFDSWSYAMSTRRSASSTTLATKQNWADSGSSEIIVDKS